MRSWVKVITINLAVLVVGLLAVELAFGGWLRAPGLWMLSVFRDVNWVYDVDNAYARTGPVTYKRDHYGLRGSFGDPAKVDILVMGGSTTDERKVSEGETWADVMAQCLAEAGQPRTVANAGVAGQSSRGHLRNLEVWLNRIPGLKPRTVVVYMGINDVSLSGREGYDDPVSYNESDRSISRIKIFRRWVSSNSALVALWNTVKGNIQAHHHGLTSLTQGAAPDRYASQIVDEGYHRASGNRIQRGSPEEEAGISAVRDARKADLDAYSGRLRALVAAIRAMNAEPVLVTQSLPSYRLTADGRAVTGKLENYFEMSAFNRVAMAVCSETSARCIPLGDTLVWEDGDTWDGIHTTSNGSRRVGLTICRGLLASPPRS